MQTLVSDGASICERRGILCWFSGGFFCTQHVCEGPYARARSTSPDCSPMERTELLLMRREEALAEIDHQVGYSNVAHLCLHLSYHFPAFCVMNFYPSLHRILNRVSCAARRAIIYGDYPRGMIHQPFVSALVSAPASSLANGNFIVGLSSNRTIPFLPFRVPPLFKVRVWQGANQMDILMR